ncbi:MAG: sodium:solute symporter, partial [Verrucomicrobia bacterium]|nr:sodium:solute symporter [Verrucomicrobiota bacterium]
MKILRIFVLIVSLFSTSLMAEDILKWTALPELPSELGVAGPFTGVHGDVLIVAGGANFPEPVWDNDKIWHDTIYALPLSREGAQWTVAGKLPRPLAYGTGVSVEEGLLCFGGNDAELVYSDVFLLKWTGDAVVTESLPDLPEPLCYAAATRLGDYIYLAGGTTGLGLETAQKNFWRLDWSKRGDAEAFQWEQLPAWPGPERAFNITLTQNNGATDCVYVIGGRHLNNNGELEFLSDVYEFNPQKSESPWRRRADIPVPQAAGTGVPVGQSHLFL